MIYQPDFEHSQTIVDAIAEEHARIFHADTRLKVVGAHVKVYCADYFGEKYVKDLGAFAQPEQEVERIQQLPVWQHAMNSFSTAGIVTAAIADTLRFHGKPR